MSTERDATHPAPPTEYTPTTEQAALDEDAGMVSPDFRDGVVAVLRNLRAALAEHLGGEGL